MMYSRLKSSIGILAVLILGTIALSGLVYARTNPANGTFTQIITPNSSHPGNSTINVIFNPGYYMRNLAMNISGRLLGLSSASNYFDTNFNVTLKGLTPYTTYQIVLTGTYGSCSYPNAPRYCLDPVMYLNLAKNVTTGANGSVVNATFYLYNTPPVNQSSNQTHNQTRVAVNFTDELNNSKADGFNFSGSYFVANSASQCALIQIASCNNNLPNQFACINDTYYSVYASQRSGMSHTICPLFMVSGKLSCGVQDNRCVVLFSGSYPNSTITTTTNPTTTVGNFNTTSGGGGIIQSLWNDILSLFKAIANLFH